MTALLPPINRTRFALIMGAATVCATGVAAALAASTDGATTNTTLIVAGIVAASLLLSVVAMLGPNFISDDAWGLAVLGTTAMRTMLAMGAMMMLIEIVKLPKEPVVYGLLGGVLLLCFAEACAAVWQIQKRDAARSKAATETSNNTPSPQAANAAPTGGPTAATRSL